MVGSPILRVSRSESFLIRLLRHPRKPSGPGAEASGALRDAGTPSCYTVTTRVVTLLVVKETELKASKHFPSPPPVFRWSRVVPLCTLAVDSSRRLHPPLEHGDLGSSPAGPLLQNLHGGSFHPAVNVAVQYPPFIPFLSIK